MGKRLKLNDYFPLIRTREEILQDIHSKRQLQFEFDLWTEEQQEEFLDICTGMKGVKIVSDPFFKEIFNPEYTPERLDDLLSHILKQKVKVLHVLPNDSVRLTAEGSLLITDLVVELEDGSIVNVEVQRIGYMFPGQRAACYSADLLLRQYRRVRDRFGKAFTYKKVKPVYTIVLFEKSPKEFLEYPDDYIHYAQATTDTGLQMELLQKFVFIPLDIFKETSQNKPIKNKTEAWLTFLSSDEPERIINLIEQYPEFKPMYDNIYELCRNVEGVMNMFSEELYILDRNTELYMMDEMQKEIDQQKKNLKSLEEKLSDNKHKIEAYDKQIDEQAQQIDEQTKQLDEQTKQIDEQTKQLDAQTKQIQEQAQLLEDKDAMIKHLQKQLNDR